MRVYTSALKHGIDPEDAVHVAEHPMRTLLMAEDPLKQMLLGFSRTGIPLEVITITTPDGSDIIIHAMKRRKQYTKLLNTKDQS